MPAILLSCLTLGACSTPGSGLGGEEARLLSLADDIGRRGDHATAAAMYERAAELSADDPQIHVRLGNARLDAGNAEAAKTSFRTALSLDIENTDALLGLGTAQLRLGEVESAVRNLHKAAPEVNTLAAWSHLGAAHALLGQGELAQHAFSQAAALSPHSPDALTNLALAHSLAGEDEEAIELMRRVNDSPLAEERHFRNMVLVLVLAQELEQAHSIALPEMSPSQRQSLIEQAARIGEIADPADRARAMGLAMAR
ncbi:tetratricopeptide repeat protein [Halomonas sp. MCCC 1A17488]|uniref:tetratricopeptide repeat protein n=1 Tax=unclassified Halomonas TaxID=2609666 RepID=UPI0018D26105|nr:MULTISPECIES: tetratricopeptide repeat protein [unclassified Halomonas]MCE8016460.1 tetratricopeptide repeat protein [Halomonas sp. MCCC 1A17488]MCG3239793.1 tetratricopeptide repeat protein [Halomonas sp. MCCC 1A17488]QPP50306.1 tetratricopeptide repeat protein [Halomonas sp. SS10-MC5]